MNFYPDILPCIMILLGLIAFYNLQKRTAAYGRYQDSSTIKIPAKIAWFVQEVPVLVVILYFIAVYSYDENQLLLFVPLIIHYFHRAILYPFTCIKGGKATPLYVMLMAFSFCTYNGYMQSYAILNQDPTFGLRSLIGILIFIIGMIINIQSDYHLSNLRKPGETSYKIPQYGLFKYVSGANFLGEIIEWIGYAIFACNFAALAFSIFTICNIGPRAVHHHNWYIEKFIDYPKNRKAIVPFLL